MFYLLTLLLSFAEFVKMKRKHLHSWKWQWMLRHLKTHRETGKNVSSLSEAPFVASCSQQMTLLLSVAEFVKMKRPHLHLMSHGNGNGCCGI